MEPPTTDAICFTPRSSSMILCRLPSGQYQGILRVRRTYFTSSLIVVSGNSGPYWPSCGSPLMFVTGLAVPYGLPKLFRQTMKNLVTSKARPAPPIKGPHQSLTSALPDNAWHMTIALSPFSESFPRVLYATGTLCKMTPDSRVKEGTIANC